MGVCARVCACVCVWMCVFVDVQPDSGSTGTVKQQLQGNDNAQTYILPVLAAMVLWPSRPWDFSVISR